MGHTLKNKQKNMCVCIHQIIRVIMMKIRMKMKNRSHRYDINRPKYTNKYTKYLSMTMLTCSKQHLSNI